MATPTPATPVQGTAGQGSAPQKPAAEKKEPTEKKAKAPKTGLARPRLPRPDENHVITVLRPNAKTRNAGDRYNLLKTGMTVKQYFDILTAPPWNRTPGQVYSDLRWNTDPNRKLIHIGPTVVPVPAPEAPKTAVA